jgi:hypothetical protein
MLVASAVFSGGTLDLAGIPILFFNYLLLASDESVTITPVAGDVPSEICPVTSTVQDAVRSVCERLRKRHSTLRASIEFRPLLFADHVSRDHVR